MEHFLYEDICITTEHDKRLLKLFTAVMEKPTRARFVESYRFGREDLEEIAVDEEEEEVEEDTGEDDDDAEGKKATVHVQSARDNSPALEDNQALTYFVIRSPSPTPSIASIASDDTDHGSLVSDFAVRSNFALLKQNSSSRTPSNSPPPTTTVSSPTLPSVPADLRKTSRSPPSSTAASCPLQSQPQTRSTQPSICRSCGRD
jgi:hypothetical protein